MSPGATVCDAVQLMQSVSMYQLPEALAACRARIGASLRLRLEPSQPYRRLAAREAPRRHDQHAFVIWGADVVFAIARDDGAGAIDHLEPFIGVEETETVALDRDAVGNLDDALRLRRPL